MGNKKPPLFGAVVWHWFTMFIEFPFETPREICIGDLSVDNRTVCRL